VNGHARTWTAACVGALIGGGLIWVLEEYVFTGGTPGVLRDLIDWLAPLAGAALLGWWAARGWPHPPDWHRPPAAPGPPDASAG
jgi:hypothetical protein